MDLLAALIRSWCTPAPLHTLEQVYVAPVGVLWVQPW
jgi:hypothetical protein